MAKIVLTHYLSCVSLRNEYNTFIALRDGVARNGCRTEVRRLHRRRWRWADERQRAGESGGPGGRIDFAGVVQRGEIAAGVGEDSRQGSDWRAFLFAWTWVATLGGVARTVGAGGAIDCDRADYCVRAFISCRAAMAGERDFAGL